MYTNDVCLRRDVGVARRRLDQIVTKGVHRDSNREVLSTGVRTIRQY